MKPRNFLAGWLGFVAQRAWLVAGVPLIVTCCAPIAEAQSCTPAPSGLVSWWRGEGNALDAAGTNPGSFLSGASYASGEAGQAFNFTASGSYVRVPASPTLDVGAGNGLTVEAWINPADLSTPGPIAEWVLNGAYAVHFYATVSFSSGCLYADLVSTSGTEHIIQTGASVLNANAYQHVALTYDKVSGVARLFRNGVMVRELTLGTFTPRTSSDLYLGYRPATSPGGPASFRGQIDEVSLYDRSLSATEIEAIYAAGSAGKCMPPLITAQPQGAVGYWGGTVQLGVGVEGTPEFSYLWHKESFPIPWGTNSTLTLTNLEFANAGNYWVAVTNLYGSTNSASALLVVNPAGVWLGTHPFLTITGTVGKTFGIEYTPQVSQTNSWIPLTTITLTEPVQEWIDTSVNAVVTPQRFYRVVPIP